MDGVTIPVKLQTIRKIMRQIEFISEEQLRINRLEGFYDVHKAINTNKIISLDKIHLFYGGTQESRSLEVVTGQMLDKLYHYYANNRFSRMGIDSVCSRAP